MAYVDGYVLPVPKKNLKTYRALARKMSKIFIEHGALAVHECAADDVKSGKWTSFPQAVKLKPNETVIFSWIVSRSRTHRDRMNAKVMKDPRVAKMMAGHSAMPFDGKRMIFGGFKEIVKA
jgi:uncharacterized protein YbaA (DUF1428 family)